MPDQTLLTRHGIAVTKIARELLACEVGARIPRIEDFSASCGVGRGTVQSALQLLAGSKAIHLESRGHLGTFLKNADFPRLWEFAGLKNLMGAMPLPYSRRNEGLATGLYAAFEHKNVPFHLSYMRGSANRVKALNEGRYDFVLLSTRAANHAVSENNGRIVHRFGPKTYVGAHALLIRSDDKPLLRRGMRVGVDSSSVDQQTLTFEMCRGVEVTYVELPYMQLFEQLVQGNIDAAVWNADEVKQWFGDDEHIQVVPLTIDEHDATEAALLVREEDHGFFQNLLKLIDLEQVVQVQRDVLDGLQVPRY